MMIRLPINNNRNVLNTNLLGLSKRNVTYYDYLLNKKLENIIKVYNKKN